MPPDPPAFDPTRIMQVLARHQVQCVVIGGYAAVLAGADVITRDVDITPALDQANLQRLADALSELHAALRVPGDPPLPFPADARLLARTEILNLTTDAGDLDITTRPDGTSGYDDLRRARDPSRSAPACKSPSRRCRTSSAQRPPPDARRTSPSSPSSQRSYSANRGKSTETSPPEPFRSAWLSWRSGPGETLLRP